LTIKIYSINNQILTMNYIIFDLEATCWVERENRQNETIEIGAVKVNDQKQIVSTYEQFIKPIRFPILSDFCKELTTITQDDVDNASYYYDAIEDFKSWIGVNDQDYILCSWGYYDRKQLESDSKVHNIEDHWVSRHISLKHQYLKFKKIKRAVSMKKALKLENIPLDGTHHRGIDDAKNIAKIFLANFDNWNFSDF